MAAKPKTSPKSLPDLLDPAMEGGSVEARRSDGGSSDAALREAIRQLGRAATPETRELTNRLEGLGIHVAGDKMRFTGSWAEEMRRELNLVLIAAAKARPKLRDPVGPIFDQLLVEVRQALPRWEGKFGVGFTGSSTSPRDEPESRLSGHPGLTEYAPSSDAISGFNTDALRDLVESTEPHQVVDFPPHDYGPVQARKPLSIQGHGAVLWSDSSRPALEICSDEISLQDLVLHGGDQPALRVKSGCQVTAQSLRVFGRVEGIDGSPEAWALPSALDLPPITTPEAWFDVELAVPVPCKLTSRIAGLIFEPSSVRPGVHMVRLRLRDLISHSLILGTMDVITPCLTRCIRLQARAGQLDSKPTSVVQVHILPDKVRAAVLAQLAPPPPIASPPRPTPTSPVPPVAPVALTPSDRLPVEPPSAATQLLHKAVNDEPDAQFELGSSFQKGAGGFSKNLTKAAEWLEKAANQGHKEAMFNLGLLYRSGEGVKQDDARSAQLFRAAADFGHAQAQFELGQCYEKGCGVKQSEAEAIQWYRRAGGNGLKKAEAAANALLLQPRSAPPASSAPPLIVRKLPSDTTPATQTAPTKSFSEEVPVAKTHIPNTLFQPVPEPASSPPISTPKAPDKAAISSLFSNPNSGSLVALDLSAPTEIVPRPQTLESRQKPPTAPAVPPTSVLFSKEEPVVLPPVNPVSPAPPKPTAPPPAPTSPLSERKAGRLFESVLCQVSATSEVVVSMSNAAAQLFPDAPPVEPLPVKPEDLPDPKLTAVLGPVFQKPPA